MPLLYKVTTPQGKINYLFGTCHSSNPTVLTLPWQVKKAFDDSRYFSCEIADTTDLKQCAKNIFEQWQQNNRQSYINEADLEYLEDASQVLQHASYSAGHYSNWLLLKCLGNTAINIIGLPPCLILLMMQLKGSLSGSNYLDKQLRNEAIKQQKPIVYLETEEEQMTLVCGEGLSYSEQKEVYRYVKSPFFGFEDMDIITDYLNEDIEKLSQNFQRIYGGAYAPQSVQYFFILCLLKQRDIRMYLRMLPSLDIGGTFVAVGAKHLLGITRLLKDSDYEVTPIQLSEKRYHITPAPISCTQSIWNIFYSKQPTAQDQLNIEDAQEDTQEDEYTLLPKNSAHSKIP